jgi:hypothetical protein
MTPIPPPPPYQPVVPTQPFWTRGKIIVLSVLLFLIIGTFGYQIGRNINPAQPPATTASGTTQTTNSGTNHTVTSLATVVPSTTSTQKQLSCSTCPGEPILPKINKVTISSTKMTWNTTFTNQTGNDITFQVQISLQDPSAGQPVDGTGPIMNKYYGFPLSAGHSDTEDIIFPFVPYVGVAYSLTASVDTGGINGQDKNISFDSITLTCTSSSCQFS